MNQFDGVPVAILCGGKGVILDGAAGRRINKALVAVLGRPLFAWVMLHYAFHGAREFILATGLQDADLRDALASALGAVAAQGDAGLYKLRLAGRDCSVRLVTTGDVAATGDRMLACRAWLEHADHFCVTYSDTLSDVDLEAEMKFHRATGMAATLVAAQLPVRFRILGMRHDEPIVRAFASRPVIESAPINGGYYIFGRSLWKEHSPADSEPALVLERDILERLARDSQLGAFAHRGLWQHFDCERDLAGLVPVAERLHSLASH